MYIQAKNKLVKRITCLSVLLGLLLPLLSLSQQLNQLYSMAYGDRKNPAIIFLHGGPGYNSFSFEASTAERLAVDGYYVICYDQRGCGRSANIKDNNYDFTEAIEDINDIYKKYKISKAVLIGHSWGGTLGLVYAEKYPEKVKAFVLVGALVSYPQTFRAIIDHCKHVYTERGSAQQMQYIELLEKMDTTTLEYANYCFLHAMSAGLYTAKTPAPNARDIYVRMMKSKDAEYINNMTTRPVEGFYKAEHYSTLDLFARLKELKDSVPVYAMYGTDDGLFDTTQLENIKATVGQNNYTLVNNASHSMFIDQQDIFISKLKSYIK